MRSGAGQAGPWMLPPLEPGCPGARALARRARRPDSCAKSPQRPASLRPPPPTPTTAPNCPTPGPAGCEAASPRRELAHPCKGGREGQRGPVVQPHSAAGQPPVLPAPPAGHQQPGVRLPAEGEGGERARHGPLCIWDMVREAAGSPKGPWRGSRPRGGTSGTLVTTVAMEIERCGGGRSTRPL